MAAKKRIGFGLLSVCGIVLLLVCFKARIPELPEGCTRVLHLQNDNEIATRSWWLSENTLLLCRYLQYGATASMEESRFSLYHRATQTETPLPELTAVLRKNRMSGYEIDLSADRRWIVWKKHKWLLPPIEDAETTSPFYYVLTVSSPAGGNVWRDHRASRRGDKIAWIQEHAPGMPEIISEWMPGCDASLRLWMSNIDGSHLHELGYISASAHLLYERGSVCDVDLSNVQWLPDGKHLSFEIYNTLYTIPAD